METRGLAAASLVVGLIAFIAPAAAADDAPLFRLFLKDGTSLVSYGEFAHVDDRVVFSMPTRASADPSALQLVNLEADLVDWDRTDRYADSTRTRRYVTTRAEDDYAALTADVARTLNEVTVATDPARRLGLVERARTTLANWPRDHFNYRSGDVRQMLSLLDEAIADLRAAQGAGHFELSLSAYSEEPAPLLVPLLPPPTLKEAIEQTLLAARLADSPVERVSLLQATVATVDAGGATLPSDWAATVRAEALATIAVERQIDNAYQELTSRVMKRVAGQAQAADVRAIEQTIERIRRRDRVLGGARPDAVNALVAAVQTQLDAARRLRLARDRWALRAPELRKYRLAVAGPMDLFAGLKPSLEDIKSLAGSKPGTLVAIRRTASRIVRAMSAIVPPEELRSAQALLVSAAQMAENAAAIRREATLSADLTRAWDASSAAAGALMLGSQARGELQSQVRPPQLALQIP